MALAKQTKFDKYRSLIFIVLFALIAGSIILITQARPLSSSNSLSLKPSSAKISASSLLKFDVIENSGTQPVNAVQANLSYPTSLYDFVSIDASASPFEVQAQSSGGNGYIYIARGHVGSLTGTQLVATVTLKPVSTTGKGQIKFTTGSAILRATDNANILNNSYGGTYTISSH